MVHLTNLALKNFTCFSDLELSFSPGVNIFIGANGTGKTHLLKVLYTACAITTGESLDKVFSEKLLKVFSPLSDRYENIIRKPTDEKQASVIVKNNNGIALFYETPTFEDELDDLLLRTPIIDKEKLQIQNWKQETIFSIYIPVKEFLSHAPGFLSLVKTRRIAFDETYSDLLTQAFLPHLIEAPFKELRGELLKALKSDDVILKGENFYLKSGDHEFEFSFVAEGLRKIALLFWLIQTGSIAPGSILFWDEPEANMNPILLKLIVKSLLTFQRAGIQVFLTTHNYVLLKEFDLQAEEEDKVRYFSLYFDDEKDGVQASVSDTYLGIENSEIARTYDDLFNREMARKFKGLSK